jgi:hypothetical protein
MPKTIDGKGQQGHSGAPPAGAEATAPASDVDLASFDGDKPSAETPPVLTDPPKEGRKRLKCEDMKGKKIIVGKGEPVQIDENGFFEVDEKEAARLLTIPGYEEA